jgi:hypothetical protein
MRELYEKRLKKIYIEKMYLEIGPAIVNHTPPSKGIILWGTESLIPYKEATIDKHINYNDVTSLYTWVSKTSKIPLDHRKRPGHTLLRSDLVKGTPD